MNRAEQLLEAGGLEPSDASNMDTTGNNKFVAKPDSPDALKGSKGFVYGSDSKKKNKQLADAEYFDAKTDAPVLVGNMFKRNRSKDILTAMTGLRG